ncbi:MerR family transcriptional regulator [Streptomyces sp. ISL-99]|uniref:MerR family transcriptional regulator n=1 Tax=Streptomyces sp. ISL-99 TaxID=2819193 RepID=UPI001BE85C05|nr:MerR family transcriptional regulator [Streptomyces sp. ISL-99]MBT2527212.1 MerR family transcriptional regulator [Streptomyces sp. ISL-99]
MRIGELSRRTGVPVPTVKYYVREGLLPPGQLTSPNQASYDETHERRLRLIRALLDVGGLKVAAIREVLAAADDPARSVHGVLGEATNSIITRYGEEADDEAVAARAEVDALMARRGWQVDPDHPAADALAAALAALGRLGHGGFARVLDDYADAAQAVARADLGYVAGRAAMDDLVESVVIGTVLGDAVFIALRRLAQVDESARIYGAGKAPR